MAEFKEMVKQYNRMCDYYFTRECNGCPMSTIGLGELTCIEYIFENPDIAEKEIMQWAKEHPNPIYPRWIDVINNMYSLPSTEAIYEPIPEHIAKLLNIKPINAEEDDDV